MKPETIDEAVRRAAEARPDALALADAPNRDAFFGGTPLRLTWRELDQAVDNLATTLEGVGAGKDVAVAVQLPNVVELVLTILACGRIGAVTVPFPIQHRRHELEYGLRTSSASIVITGARPDRPDQLETVAALASDLDQPIRILTFGAETIDGATVLTVDPSDTAGAPAQVASTGGPDDVLTICWTSGTTGTPKGVPRTPAMWLASGHVQVNELNLDPEDHRWCCAFPPSAP
jgi:acyl-CoA synthetase (AMP-forming)/AMP-acid ligase II